MSHSLSFLLTATPLLLQAAPDPATVAAVVETLKKQGGQTTDLLKDYGALVNVLYLLAGLFAVATALLVWWIVRKGESYAATVQATCASMIKPLEDAYRIASSEMKEKHAMEIRGNEANHQAQLRAMEKQADALNKQIEASNEERRKVAETANTAYREMTEVLRPFTDSNHAVAARLHDVERLLAELKGAIPKP